LRLSIYLLWVVESVTYLIEQALAKVQNDQHA